MFLFKQNITKRQKVHDITQFLSENSHSIADKELANKIDRVVAERDRVLLKNIRQILDETRQIQQCIQTEVNYFRYMFNEDAHYKQVKAQIRSIKSEIVRSFLPKE